MTWPAWQRVDPPLILASASEARRSLLASAGLCFDVCPSEVDERLLKRRADHEQWEPSRLALELAGAKALRVSSHRADALVIGADQVLCVEGKRIDKPRTIAQARDQLSVLRGKRHLLHTATVLAKRGRTVWQHIVTPVLLTRDFSDTLLDLYLVSEGDILLSSPGACRVEERGALLFEAIDGEQSAIMGLPMLAVLEALRRQDVIMS